MGDIIIAATYSASRYLTKAQGGASMNRIIHSKQCIQCGKTFNSKRSDAKYCSAYCRQEEYNKKWRLLNPNYWINYYKNGRGVDVQKKRHEKHPMHRKARTAVSNALRLGKIIKPAVCQVCGCHEKLEAHHWKGYSQEYWLDVQWLCHSDHLKADNA